MLDPKRFYNDNAQKLRQEIMRDVVDKQLRFFQVHARMPEDDLLKTRHWLARRIYDGYSREARIFRKKTLNGPKWYDQFPKAELS